MPPPRTWDGDGQNWPGWSCKCRLAVKAGCNPPSPRQCGAIAVSYFSLVPFIALRYIVYMKFTSTALKQMTRMDRRQAQRVMEALQRYEATGQGDVKKLQGRDGYRLRIGDYRALFERTDDQITVIEVGPRGDIYK